MKRDFLIPSEFWHTKAARIFLLLLSCWLVVAPVAHVCDQGFAPRSASSEIAHSHGVHSQHAHADDAPQKAASTRAVAATPPLCADDCGACLACLLASMPGRDAAFIVLAPSLREFRVPATRLFLSYINCVFRGEYSRGPPVA